VEGEDFPTDEGFETNTDSMEFFIFISVILVVVGVMLFLTRISFEARKERLENLYSSLLSDMNIDLSEHTITPQNIQDITKSMLYFSDEVSLLARLSKNTSLDNQRWLVDIIEAFNTSLKLWMSRHEDELLLQQREIQGQIHTTDTQTGKAALELASKRLDSEKNTLEKLLTLV